MLPETSMEELKQGTGSEEVVVTSWTETASGHNSPSLREGRACIKALTRLLFMGPSGLFGPQDKSGAG